MDTETGEVTDLELQITGLQIIVNSIVYNQVFPKCVLLTISICGQVMDGLSTRTLQMWILDIPSVHSPSYSTHIQLSCVLLSSGKSVCLPTGQGPGPTQSW